MKVSIAMATYNGEKYLKEQLDSIYNQTYKDIELIVCDDCSSDNTVEILEDYSKKFGLKYFVNETNLGFKKSFEKVISLCKGEFIALADQDDIWKANKIEALVVNIGDYSLIHCAYSLIDKNSKLISFYHKVKRNFSKEIFTRLIFGNFVTGCTVLFKRELLKDFFPVPTGEKYHDWWLALLAVKQNGIKYLNEELVQYRQHDEQVTGVMVDSPIKILIVYIKGFFFRDKSIRYLFMLNRQKTINSFLDERGDFFSDKEKKVIYDALLYYNDYLKNFIHIKSFFICLKYYNKIYHDRKNIFKYIYHLIYNFVG